uniref:Uncharacterized protein n=1 Tax=Chromera velia CCMP2878 TaxID=1169474 RepID=A0A0G4FXG3_9ALVE|mmetsp:Transcript_8422/g.16362  ORF Transcript_8422/g.16362 Transcript_8422/m.16362 type:complete len:637 (-) Transcript_8422:474-2384(-)|eukprot:Cvel_19262.t1-p1 / transcript=Cvel_19262.t1 / gene=Cvel_19262 / organism=Chromera_velia_CCMP2878 / gene_product=T-complex protein 11 homolog, putative / transcript_product=T-complex protein 11 homolog, putative / location=Cvel_scaffold1649:3952-6500(+) / protein_length=636 / sequence_SO=supercontig / SO=protein_coding / is_pseudo=false
MATQETANGTKPIDMSGPLLSEVAELLRSIHISGPSTSADQVNRLNELTVRVAQTHGPDGVEKVKAYAASLNDATTAWRTLHTIRVAGDKLTVDPTTGQVQGGSSASTQEQALTNQIADMVKKAYWDVTKEKLAQTPPDYSIVLDRLAELKVSLAKWMPERYKAAFIERVDMKLLEQEIEQQQFNRDSLFKIGAFLVKTLGDLESEFQHEKTQEKFKEMMEKVPQSAEEFHVQIVDLLAFLFSRVDILQAEVKAFHLKKQSKAQREMAERRHFARMLDRGDLTLDKTSELFFQFADPAAEGNYEPKTSSLNLSAPSQLAAQTPPVTVPPEQKEDEKESTPPSAEMLFTKMLASLVCQPEAVKGSECPETLLPEIPRLHQLQDGIQRAAVMALLALQLSPLLMKLPTSSPNTPEEARVASAKTALVKKVTASVFGMIEEALKKPTIDFKALEEAIVTSLDEGNASLAAALKEMGGKDAETAASSLKVISEEERAEIADRLKKFTQPDSAVLALMLKRAKSAVFKGLCEMAAMSQVMRGLPPGARCEPMAAMSAFREAISMGDSPWQLVFATASVESVIKEVFLFQKEHWTVYEFVYKKLWHEKYGGLVTPPVSSRVSSPRYPNCPTSAPASPMPDRP